MPRPKKVTSNQESGSINFTAVNVSVELPSIGLGDTISKITSFFGVEPCAPCEERKKKLNRMFGYLKWDELEALSQRELEILEDMDRTQTLKQEYRDELFLAYNKRFVQDVRKYIKSCLCPGIILKIKETLDLLKK
jgi:hypothetical protein